MSNDIQKYRYLIETIILDESFKDAERIFTDVCGNQKEVSNYIELFKELAKRNKIQGMEKDISRWIKSGWVEFKEFVDSKKEVQSKRETKAVQKKDSIRVQQDEEKIVVIPLSKEASIHYGRNTEWCTAYTKALNQFTKYFYINGITLFYVLFKNGDKYACAFHPDHPDTIECFDQLDKSISFNEFSDATGISKNDIHEWYSGNKGVIMKSQDNLDEEAQIELVKEDVYAIDYIIKKGITPSVQVQLAVVKQDSEALEYFIGEGFEPSEAVQLAAVQTQGNAIEHIDNPSEEVQLAAVQQNGYAIVYIDSPSEEVQLAAVQNQGSAIRHIINKGITPSETVQLAAAQNYDGVIQYVGNPSEAVQLAAVQTQGGAIRYIDNPSEAVQLAAVQSHGRAIEYIIKKGIEPSETVQLAAVEQNGFAIEHIDNPTEEVQLAAVQQSGYAFRIIINKGITPSEKVKALQNKLYT